MAARLAYWYAAAIMLLNIPMYARDEGTRELFANDCNNYGSIQIWDNGDTNRLFATYGAPEEYRLYIYMNSGETLYFGYNNPDEDVWYRLRDPDGVIVKGPELITSASSKGWISSCSEAITGPEELYSGGYDALSYTATKTGNYYIEFAEDNDPTKHNKRIIEYFDATVVSGSKEKPGRLWSKAWDINCQGSNNAFMASMYVYSTDSVVTKIDFNGIRPWGFVISCNSQGASNVGDPVNRRKSDYRANILNAGGSPGVPEYPIFLNEPDSLIYPSGVVGKIDSFNITGCDSSSLCIYVDATASRQVEIQLDFQNYVTRTIVTTVNKGSNCISWDGYDGNNTYVSGIDTVSVTLKYTTGMTHLPMTDVENHLNGFSVSLIRPSKQADGSPLPPVMMFWNDSLLTDYSNSLDGVANLTGTTGPAHKWQNRGTNNSNPEVINTWWYTSLSMNNSFVTCPLLLDLQIDYFTGKTEGRVNVLEWTSYEENALAGYRVQRSTNGMNWKSLGFVKAAGEPASYAWTDSLVKQNTVYYYRLEFLGPNGHSRYSDVIILQTGNFEQDIQAIFYDNTLVFSSGTKKSIRYALYSISGQKLTEGNAVTNQPITLYIRDPGIYILQFMNKETGTVCSQKIRIL